MTVQTEVGALSRVPRNRGWNNVSSPQILLEGRACPEGHTAGIWIDPVTVSFLSLLDMVSRETFGFMLPDSYMETVFPCGGLQDGEGPMFLSQCELCVPTEIPVACPLSPSPAPCLLGARFSEMSCWSRP